MTLFRYLIFRDVNYPISLQTPMLDKVTSFLLPRNVQNTCNNARYILNKKCSNMYENEVADQLGGNSVTDQRLCSRFLNPGISTVENR